MKKRPNGFLSKVDFDSDSEIADYIRELHWYLWGFVRAVMPGAGGHLNDYVDKVLELVKKQNEYYRIRYPLKSKEAK